MRTADMTTPGRAKIGCRPGSSPRRVLNKHCHTRMINLLLVAALLPIAISDGAPAQELYLQCSGEYSTLTHDDCHGIYHDNTAACYYNSISSQYWPCAKFCNNKLFPSREAQQCQSKCPAYYQNCQHLQITTTSQPPPRTPPGRITTIPTPGLKKWMIAVIVIGALIAVVAAVLIPLLLVRTCCKKQPNPTQNDYVATQDSYRPDPEQSNQEGMRLVGQPDTGLCTESNYPNPNALNPHTEEGEGDTFIGGDGQTSSGYSTCTTSVNSSEHIFSQDQTENGDQTLTDPVSDTSPFANPENPGFDSGRTPGPNVLLESTTSQDQKGNLRVDMLEYGRNGGNSEDN